MRVGLRTSAAESAWNLTGRATAPSSNVRKVSYPYDSHKKKRTRTWVRRNKSSFLEFESLLLFFLLLAGLATITLRGLRLGFGFFHGFLGLGYSLGAGFGAFFALLVEHLLAAQQFDECLFGAIALLPCRADDAQIAAIAVAETRSRWCRTAWSRPRSVIRYDRARRRADRSPRLPSVIIFSTCGRMALAFGIVVSIRSSIISEVTRFRSSERRCAVLRPSFHPATL